MFALLKIRWDTKAVSVLMIGDAESVNKEYLRLIERNESRSYSVSYDLKVRKAAS